ncbi:MAG: DNA gyrase C-terminal beta-propeller domain-containing protein, partial [Thermomonas sp.]
TSAGRVFWLPVYQLPDTGPNARGRPIINWIPLEAGEKVQAVLPVRDYDPGKFLFFATRNGRVKKTPLTEYAYRLQRGKIAINLDEGDALVGVALTDGERDVLLFASNGKTVRFGEDRVRSMGRTATGVRGIRLAKGEGVVSLIVAESAGGIEVEGYDGVNEEVIDTRIGIGDDIVESIESDNDGVAYILTATENGYGKRTSLSEYPRKGRGTQGVIGIQTTERNGKLVGAIMLGGNDEVLLISDGGTLVRTPGLQISRVGRNTQGVTLIRLSKGEKLQAVERLDVSLDEDAEDDANATATGNPGDEVIQGAPPAV